MKPQHKRGLCFAAFIFLAVVVTLSAVLTRTNKAQGGSNNPDQDNPVKDKDPELQNMQEVSKDPETQNWPLVGRDGLTLGNFLGPLSKLDLNNYEPAINLIPQSLTCALGGLGAQAFLPISVLQRQRPSAVNLPAQRLWNLIPWTTRQGVMMAIDLAEAIYLNVFPVDRFPMLTTVALHLTPRLGTVAHGIFAMNSTRILYVVVRGSTQPLDFIASAVALPTKFLEGRAHAGIVFASMQVFDMVRPVVEDFLKGNPGWRVVCVGHSLGGAIASLLAARFRIGNSPNPIEAFALSFGAPPIVHLLNLQTLSLLARTLRDAVVSFVAGEDIVPNLTVEFVKILHENAELICRDPEAFIARHIGALTPPTVGPNDPQVCLAGNNFHIFETNPVVQRLRGPQTLMRQGNCGVLGGVSRNAFRHHAITYYRRILASVPA